jgi:hypothetical protein
MATADCTAPTVRELRRSPNVIPTDAMLAELQQRLALVNDTVEVVVAALHHEATTDMLAVARLLQQHVSNELFDCIEILEKAAPDSTT